MTAQLLRRLARRTPGLRRAVHTARQWTGDAEKRREFREFRRAYAGRIDPRPDTAAHGHVLVVSLLGDFTTGAIIEGFLAKSMQLAGLEPVFVSAGGWAGRYHATFGLRNAVDFPRQREKARSAVKASRLEQRILDLDSAQALLALEYGGVAIGRYVVSTLIRQTYRGSIDPNDPEMRPRVSAALREAAVSVEAAERIYDDVKPEAVLLLERGYSPFGEFFDLALRRGLNTIQWCGSHDPRRLIFKRYNSGNADQHPFSLSQESWKTVQALPWDEARARHLHEEIHGGYASGQWYAEVGTQFAAQLMASDDVRRELRVAPGRKLAVIFSHLFWDATFFWGEDLFDDYRDWFVQTVKAAVRNDRLDWVVKLHPANSVKLARDGYVGEPVELAAIRSEIGDLPDHVRILLPDTSISTFSLFEAMDYGVTVRGTVGVEAAALGRPVLTAGTGRYDRHGFTVDSDSRAEYLVRLAGLESLPPLGEERCELARQFAYASFVLRPFPLRTLHVHHERDARATLRVGIETPSAHAFRTAADVREFGQWAVHRRDEDYLRSGAGSGSGDAS